VKEKKLAPPYVLIIHLRQLLFIYIMLKLIM